MNKEEAISFAGLMEEYLNIPSFVCEMIQHQLEENKYKEVIEYVIQRRNELESKETYKSYQDMIKMYLELQERINKATEYCDREIGNIIANYEYIDTADLENVRKILKGE